VSQCSGLVAKTHFSERESAKQTIIVRLLSDEAFQFSARLLPASLGGNMIANTS